MAIVQNYRAINIGGVLVWIALPQFLLAPIVATILRFIDPRFTLAFGFALIGVACFMAGSSPAIGWAPIFCRRKSCRRSGSPSR